MRNKLFLGVAAAALVMPAAAMAQETTSIIRGTVTAGGAPVAGANVTVTDVNSGTKSTTATGPDGGFTASGLRAGGPYTVDIASPQGNSTVTDIYTVVGQPYDLPVELAPAAASTGADIVVTASSIRGAGTSSDGPQTVLTQADVRKVASVNRDIRDIERRSPFATLDLTNGTYGAVSFAGVNPRFNRFTINGVQVGDQFGLNPDASPTGRGPIPYDAIGQVAVSIAPYDFRQGNFQGGAIDTVLLAGTNEFHGTGFYSQSTDGIQGDRIGSNRVTVPKYKSETYGATLRGPIIPDRLFFMVSAERNTDPRPFSPNSVSGVPGLTATAVSNIQSIANGVYGYDTGPVLQVNPQKDEKIVGRIDWNVTTGQRLSISYINAFDSFQALQNTSTTTTGPSLGLASDAYETTELLRAGIAQLNSDWTDNFSTEARFIYRSTKRGQEPLQGRGFGQFGVCLDPTSVGSFTACTAAPTGGIATPRVFFGPDISRQTNTLFTDTWAGSLLSRLTLNNHELKLLAEFNENRTSNNFLQYSLGGFYFDSVADLQNRRAGQLVYGAALNGQPDGAAAQFHYDQWTFGIQDDWRVTDTFKLSYGVRYDLYGMENAPAYNPFFQARYGFPNTKTYKGLDNFQPRVSFDWKPINRLSLRGGFAIFGGGSPDIYLSNSFSNTILSNRVTFSRANNPNGCTISGVSTAAIGVFNPTYSAVCAAALNNVSGSSIPSVVQQYVTSVNPTSLQASNTGALDPHFKLPSVYKASLSADYNIFGIDFGFDYLHTSTREGLVFTDIRSQVVGTLPDGRPRYNSVLGFTDSNYDILLTNSGKGHSNIGVIRFDKAFDWGLSLGGSYTLQSVKDLSAATSSTINSNYANQAMADPNYPAFGTSNDETKWAFKYNLGYEHAFYRDYKTTIQLFGETHAGRPYSFTMADLTPSYPTGTSSISCTRACTFGTLLNNNRYLLYVPTGPNDPLVSYDSAATQSALDTLIGNTALRNFRGKIAGKNIARSSAFTRIDLHLEQEFPTFIGKSRVSLFADIQNLPNLLNHNWGGVRQQPFPYTADVVRVQCLSAAVPTGTAVAPIGTPAGNNPNGLPTVVNTNSTQPCAQYRYSSFAQPNEKNVYLQQSLYLIRIGARFRF